VIPEAPKRLRPAALRASSCSRSGSFGRLVAAGAIVDDVLTRPRAVNTRRHAQGRRVLPAPAGRRNYTPLDDLLAVYDRAWRVRTSSTIARQPRAGRRLLTASHEEARRAAGREALRRFWNHEEAEGTKPSWWKKNSALRSAPTGFADIRPRGRRPPGAIIVDYKTTEITRQKDADRRVAESLQLKMYALAWQEMTGTLPSGSSCASSIRTSWPPHADRERPREGGRRRQEGRGRYPRAALRRHAFVGRLP